MSHKANAWLAGLDPAQVKAGAFRVLFHLCDHHNDSRDPTRACFPTQEALRERTGLSNGALNAALSAMEEAGLILRRRGTAPGSRMQRTYYILGCDFDLLPEQTPENGVCTNSGAPEAVAVSNSGGPESVDEQTPVFGVTNSGAPERILKVTVNTTTAHARDGHLAAECLAVCGPAICRTGRRSLAESDEVIEGWIGEGFDLHLDVLPVLTERTCKPIDRVIRSWDYFTAAIRRAHARRLRGQQAGQAAENQQVGAGAPDSDPVAHLAALLNAGRYVPPSAVSTATRSALLARGLVTQETLRAYQIY